MTHLNIAMIVYVVISLGAITTLMYFLVECRKKCDSFSTCQGMGNKVCPNLKLLHKAYNDGKLTEFTNFGAHPRQWQEMGWDKFTPYQAEHRSCR
jgi:hypothetical protein